MTTARILVLVEQLVPLLSAAPPGIRLPALETILSRGSLRRGNFSDPNEVRFELFGLEAHGPLPIGALTRLRDLGGKSNDNYYCLRADPVTLWADMARVIMTSHGFADLDPLERKEIENTIRAVLHDEGMAFGSEHPERWTIALKHPLNFNFSPLKKALGMDAAEALPDHPEALHWRRILNEIQMALHACPVNLRRRQQGRQEINSVWFWGGGYLPEATTPQPFQTVYSDHPVSSGLALVHDCPLTELGAANGFDCSNEANPDRAKILIDWTPHQGAVGTQLEQLETLANHLLKLVRKCGVTVEIYAADGTRWRFDRGRSFRFWQRSQPVQRFINAAE